MSRTITLGSRQFDLDKKPLLMGILNVTPDSFSDGGQHSTLETAYRHAMRMMEEGADIIDVGGESSRPGSREVPPAEEIQRIVPVIKKIRQQNDIPISIDTRKAEVFDAAIQAGADILNDISGLKHDAQILNVLQRNRLPVIIMHMKGIPETMQQNPVYEDVITEISSFLVQQAHVAESAGASQVIIDPGIGFGKTTAHNLLLIKYLDSFVSTGYPVLLGSSRKRFIGETLDLPVDERLEGTLATAAIGIANGADIVRLHDIKAGRRVIDMAHAIRHVN